jgi:predicted ATPase
MSAKCQNCGALHDPKLVVLTGGPGAGKTAVLELVKKYLCSHVAILPEAASIIYGGGFVRRDTLPARKAGQRAILHVQRELERLTIEEGNCGVILCDRGTLDGLAYWPEDASSFLQDLGIDWAKELNRYYAVIHLRTPPANEYNHHNPVRTETACEAVGVDRRIETAWNGHPRRSYVDSSTDFFEKAQEAIRLIRAFLPECCKAHLIGLKAP